MNKAKFMLIVVLAAVLAVCAGVYVFVSCGAGGRETTSAAPTVERTSQASTQKQTEPQTSAETTTQTETTTRAETTTQTGTEERTGTQTTTKTQPVDENNPYAYAGIKPVVIDLGASPWNLILLNINRRLPFDYAADLAQAAPGYSTKLDARAAPHYRDMFNAAKDDGLTLVPLSGNRRISTQKTNFENKIAYWENQGYNKTEATKKAAQTILPPGCSEHNAGLAMDICSLYTSFENTDEFAWLQKHAADYGFILRYPAGKYDITKVSYEPWHWRYVGVAAAKEIKASGQCLEEYLG